jgi:hypothetical protein
MNATQELDIRPSPIAGTWYPGQAESLRRSVDGYLQAAQIEPLPGAAEIIGIIAPHAGHIYSGQVAAYAFRYLQGMQVDLAAVVSPLHHPYPGRVCTTAHSAYATPLGSVPVDTGALAALESHLPPELAPLPIHNDQEHSLEIELPFLQRTLRGDFQLLPLMLRDQSTHTCQSLGHALAHVLRDRNALLVASTDLSHFYPAPMAERLDRRMLQLIESFDPQAVLAAEEQGIAFACGRAAVATVLWAAKELGATHCKVVHYAHSGHVTGDMSSVVGYGAAVIYRQ